MNSLLSSRHSNSLRIPLALLNRSYHIGRAGNVNTAIERSLRGSGATGFRQPRKIPDGDLREKYRIKHGIPEYTGPKPRKSDLRKERQAEKTGSEYTAKPRKSELRREEKQAQKFGLEQSAYEELSNKRSEEPWKARGSSKNYERPATRNPIDLSRGWAAQGSKRSEPSWKNTRGRSKNYDTPKPRKSSELSTGQTAARDTQKPENMPSLAPKWPGHETKPRNRNDSYISGPDKLRNLQDNVPKEPRSNDKYSTERGFRDRSSTGSYETRFSESARPTGDFVRGRDRIGRGAQQFGGMDNVSNDRSSRYETADEGRFRSSNDKWAPKNGGEDRLTERRAGRYGDADHGHSNTFGDKEPPKSGRSARPEEKQSGEASSRQLTVNTFDSRTPLSIPYTTPASEFLYGTFVVEAALTSRRIPRRQLYKLYIFTGEGREDVERDSRLERLAKNNGVAVQRVGNEWMRLMDKMSGGRPHNGYILEASPLPRLPITSLGRLTNKDGLDGFEVTLDYQSKEEAMVNGTSNFVRAPKLSGRKPFVLLLDSIVDPGNLGGIIRTASFLGVTAVAISTRNSAPFSPVVLKASGGASENMTIFSVNKPAGFIVHSKAAGWKVFAAVAPEKRGDPDMPLSVSTDRLGNPLSESPCILMLGSEGEGLRWNMRNKADVDLYIQGSGRSHKLDSLNVSVAAGVLCQSFLSRSQSQPVITPKNLESKDNEPEPDSEDFQIQKPVMPAISNNLF